MGDHGDGRNVPRTRSDRATGDAVRGRADHPAGAGIKPTSIFTNAEGTKLCWEYVHTAVVTDQWPSSTHRPAPGTKINVPLALLCEIDQGRLVRVREYFDMLTASEPGTAHHLYS
jgi:hypothetical protein